MRIVIVGGGTGGHLYPGIAVAQELKRWDPRARIMFIGSRGGLERDIVAREGYRHFEITSSGLARRQWREQLVAMGHLLQGFGEAVRVLRRVQPQVILGLGSYVSGSVLLAAGALGIPRLIHEQNVLPGLTNRLLGRVVNRVAVSFEASVAHFPQGKAVVTGNPVRPAICQVRGRGHKPNGRFHLLVFGGSQGAHHLNVAVLEALPQLADIREHLWIVHQTGSSDFAIAQATYAKGSYPGVVHAYIQDMAQEYGAADLVICRAGATTIAELTVTGKAAMLVPFPYATHHHQEHNARTLAIVGAAELIQDQALSSGLLTERIRHYLSHPEATAAMAARCLALGKPDAATRVAHLCLQLCRI
jgi:UDP-N-acetylglucosamine--N-acetylmuramyl-(pentapeptide) pyrophosphoryl-undecaprenol N-acetylglucosamine transferase